MSAKIIGGLQLQCECGQRKEPMIEERKSFPLISWISEAKRYENYKFIFTQCDFKTVFKYTNMHEMEN